MRLRFWGLVLFVCDSDQFNSRAYSICFVLVCGSLRYFVWVRFGLRTVLSFDKCWLENVWVLYMISTQSPHFDTLSHFVILHTYFVTW